MGDWLGLEWRGCGGGWGGGVNASAFCVHDVTARVRMCARTCLFCLSACTCVWLEAGGGGGWLECGCEVLKMLV